MALNHEIDENSVWYTSPDISSWEALEEACKYDPELSGGYTFDTYKPLQAVIDALQERINLTTDLYKFPPRRELYENRYNGFQRFQILKKIQEFMLKLATDVFLTIDETFMIVKKSSNHQFRKTDLEDIRYRDEIPNLIEKMRFDETDHSILILPDNYTTYQEDELNIFQKFLTNCIYWLNEMRYVSADKFTTYSKYIMKYVTWNYERSKNYNTNTIYVNYEKMPDGTTIQDVMYNNPQLYYTYQEIDDTFPFVIQNDENIVMTRYTDYIYDEDTKKYKPYDHYTKGYDYEGTFLPGQMYVSNPFFINADFYVIAAQQGAAAHQDLLQATETFDNKPRFNKVIDQRTGAETYQIGDSYIQPYVQRDYKYFNGFKLDYALCGEITGTSLRAPFVGTELSNQIDSYNGDFKGGTPHPYSTTKHAYGEGERAYGTEKIIDGFNMTGSSGKPSFVKTLSSFQQNYCWYDIDTNGFPVYSSYSYLYGYPEAIGWPSDYDNLLLKDYKYSFKFSRYNYTCYYSFFDLGPYFRYSPVKK